MERCVEEFLRSVRNGETGLNMTETESTEHALSYQDTASPIVVQKTANKNKSGMKTQFHCEICNVAVYDVETLKIHLNGKKHMKKQKCFLKIHVGEEFIKKENSCGIPIAKCELCSEQILSVSTHVNSYSHLLAVLKTKHPKVFENLQLRGLNKIRKEELKRIVVAEMFPEAFQQYGNLSNPAAIENIFPDPNKCTAHVEKAGSNTEIVAAISTSSTLQTVFSNDQKSGCDEDCQPPAKRARMNNPPFINKSDTISEHMKDKNSDLVQNEKKDKASDQRQIQPGFQQYKECKTRIDLKHNGSEGTFKIACNEDLYMFLQYFQISDETDVMFIQKIVKKFKSQLQEFNENTQQMTTVSDLNDVKEQEDPVSKLKTSERAESILQHADSTTTSNANECTSNKSGGDIKDHCKCRTNSSELPALYSNIKDRRLEDVSTVNHVPENNFSKVTTAQATTSNSVSSHHSSDMLCHTTKKPIIRPSVSSSVLKSHHLSIASIKKEPDADASVEDPQPDCTTATNKPMVTGTTGSSLPIFDSSGILSTGKPKCIIRPSVLSSVLKKSLPLEPHISNKKEPDTLASDEHQTSPQGCIDSSKAQSHCHSKSQPSSTDLESPLTSDKNNVASVAKKPRIDHLNLPTSPSNTHDANSISFGGKKDMQISELIAEVAKFADTKPVLKGIDINQVVQILIRNRSEKNRNESQDSSA